MSRASSIFVYTHTQYRQAQDVETWETRSAFRHDPCQRYAARFTCAPAATSAKRRN